MKTLRELETIRESKKRSILDQVLGAEASSTCDTLSVMPGQLAFPHPITVQNTTMSQQVYRVEIIDHQADLTNGTSELQLVQDGEEWKKLVYKRDGLARPHNFDMIRHNGDFSLESGQSVDLLFKFLTKREVSLSATQASTKVIVPRRITIRIKLNQKPLFDKEI